MNKKELIAALDELGMRPGRGLGQNFLLDGNLLDAIARINAPEPDEEILEVGPGFGALTGRLLAAGARVTAIEFDRRLAEMKDLLKPGDSCLGGGYYHFDYASNRIILDRSSYDFGKPKWHLLEVLKVPSVYRGLRLVYFYDDGREFDVSQELQIEYYD